jgi:hypothetical protein
MSVYVDPIIKKLFDTIDASDGGSIKRFFYGDPLLVAKSDLPILIASKDNTIIGDESNAEDYHRMNIVLTLVVDIRQSLGDDDNYDVHAGWQKLYDIIEGRESTFELKSTSLIDILRSNEDLGNNAHIDLQNPMNVDYGLTLGKRGENSWAWEANITVPIFFSQIRS